MDCVLSSLLLRVRVAGRYGTWTYIGTVATEADFPGAGEGPNEHGITLLADGSTLTVVFRLDNGDGNPLHPL